MAITTVTATGKLSDIAGAPQNLSMIRFTPRGCDKSGPAIITGAPTDLPAALKRGWWGSEAQRAGDRCDAISAVPDGFGLSDMMQGTAANQPILKLVGDVRVISLSVDTGITHLPPASALRAGYVFAVAQYGTGL